MRETFWDCLGLLASVKWMKESGFKQIIFTLYSKNVVDFFNGAVHGQSH